MSGPPVDRRGSGPDARWRQVVEATHEVYVAVDGEGRVADWNPAAERLFGLAAQAVLGTPVGRLVAEDDVPTLEKWLAAAVERAGVAGVPPLEVEGRAALGPATVEWAVWGVDRRGGVVVHTFVRDVTERRRAQHTASLLAAVVEGTSDSVMTRDLDGTILTWNPGAEAMHGWSAQEAVGQHVSLIVPEDKRDELDDLHEHLTRGELVREVETERLTKGGTRIPVALRLSPVRDDDGRLVGVSAIARDITEQRWMAETLDSTLSQLQVALDEARASEEASRRFLADAAHQLRTPLTGIRACAELLLLGSPKTDKDKLLATMVRETSRAGRLITALLRIARLDQGEPLPEGDVDVVALCADEVDRLQVLAPHLAVRLDVRTAPPGLLPVAAGSVQEVLGNLGDNAVRHAASAVVLVVDASDGFVSVTVADDGPGVPEHARESVFQRFVSLDGKGGSGLGLPIARGLARAMGGDLRYEDGFVLTLPVSEPSSAAASA